MKRNQFLVVALCLGIFAVQSVWARSPHRPRSQVSVIVGPVWSPYWFPPPWYYQPPILIAPPPPPPPPIYIEQVAPRSAAPSADYWYYCKSTQAYYPAVAECADGWLAVLPQPEK